MGGGQWVVEVVMVVAAAVEVVLVLDGGWCVARAATCAGNGSAPCAGVVVRGAQRIRFVRADQRHATPPTPPPPPPLALSPPPQPTPPSCTTATTTATRYCAHRRPLASAITHIAPAIVGTRYCRLLQNTAPATVGYCKTRHPLLSAIAEHCTRYCRLLQKAAPAVVGYCVAIVQMSP